jgi:hypothetical protein
MIVRLLTGLRSCGRYYLALILVAGMGCSGFWAARAADVPGDKTINYSVGRKSVQYVVIDIAGQVGLGYNWDKSAAQADPERRMWVNNLRIKNKTFDAAMQQVLKPAGLRYEIEDGKVVLYRR